MTQETETNTVLISIIIPHLNQPEHLRRGLAAIHEQTGFDGGIEVIVVDNGSDIMPGEICGEWPGTQLVQEPTPGPGPARNTGIKHASGDILAFIDADCRANPGWLSAIANAIKDSKINVIGGDVQVPFVDESHPTSLECYERIYGFRNREYIASGYSGTGNLAMRPTAYAKVGPFAGIELAEDRDWGLRAKGLGIATHYVADMIVYHPARQKFLEMQQKWDRHIAHDFSNVSSLRDRIKWVIRAIVIGLSPLGEIPKVLKSDRVSGAKQRRLAFACLARIRLYRFRKMIAVLIRGNGHALSGAWNRE